MCIAHIKNSVLLKIHINLQNLARTKLYQFIIKWLVSTSRVNSTNLAVAHCATARLVDIQGVPKGTYTF